jgi:hypothetical protein
MIIANDTIQVRVDARADYLFMKQLYFKMGENSVIKEIIWEEHNGTMCKGADFSLDDVASQVLMDDLWACGVRPTEGSGSAGSLKATENHLDDMRKIAFNRLKIG